MKSMMSAIALSAVTLSAVAFSAQTALASKFNFRVYNNAGSRITGLYVSESRFTGWGNNILSHSLSSGNNTQILFGNMSPENCFYDFRAVFADGDVVQDFGVNVCSTSWFEYY